MCLMSRCWPLTVVCCWWLVKHHQPEALEGAAVLLQNMLRHVPGQQLQCTGCPTACRGACINKELLF
jgi:hypothetical protein